MTTLNDLIETLPPNCKHIYKKLDLVFNDDMFIEHIINYISVQKKVIIEYRPMQLDRTGVVLSLIDCFYIIIRSDINKRRKRITLLHELSHILLNHIKQLEITLDMIENESIALYGVFDHIRGNTYTLLHEFEAESLATVLHLKIQQCEDLSSLPQIMKDDLKDQYKL